jgi:hypothetical protein
MSLETISDRVSWQFPYYNRSDLTGLIWFARSGNLLLMKIVFRTYKPVIKHGGELPFTPTASAIFSNQIGVTRP